MHNQYCASSKKSKNTDWGVAGGIPVSLVFESRADLGPGTTGLAAASVPAASVPAEVEYHFLLGRYVDAAILARASALAAQWGVHPHEVLIANGWLSAEDYYRALAETCGTDFTTFEPAETALPAKASPRHCLANGILKERARASRFVYAANHLRPNALRAMLARLAPCELALATPQAVREGIYHHFAPALVRGAVETLAARRPDFSARSRTAPWQRCFLIAGSAGVGGALLLAPIATIHAVTLLLAVLFLPAIALRVLGVYELMRKDVETSPSRVPRTSDAFLPTYTILAPLFREAHMLPPLVRALTQLDWPAAKLDIKLVLEAVDTETVAAARALTLPGNVEIVVVPDRAPRTKPKALNYALPLARGEYLVIYDAEDRPEPDQLRRAYAAFAERPPNLATVQARLNIYNPDAGWLARQFTLEYSALFDGLLPVLDRLKLPIPLGGTSNHFRGIA